MNFSKLLLLSLIQGITEFLPVSSTAHLVLAAYFLPGIQPDLFLDTVLHLGTLLAIVVYFRRRWIKILHTPRLLANIAICSLPAAITGFLFKDTIEAYLRQPLSVAVALLAGAAVLWLADQRKPKNSSPNFSTLSPRKSLLIGLFQSLALIPGASRAGMTIAGGLFCGLKHEEAADFSFLAAVPIIAGAALLEVIEVSTELPDINWAHTTLGLLFSFIFGLLGINWLMKFLKEKSFKPFIAYRILLGIVILILTNFIA